MEQAVEHLNRAHQAEYQNWQISNNSVFKELEMSLCLKKIFSCNI